MGDNPHAMLACMTLDGAHAPGRTRVVSGELVNAMSLPSFGELLKCYRLAARLTQEDLAEQARLSRRGISDLERGVNRTPRKETVALLGQALNLSAPQRAAFAEARQRRTLSPPVEGPTALAANAMPRLIGREHELEQVKRHISPAGAPVLLLAGEPGIGKTRLLQEAAAYARDRGFQVLVGGCQRRDAAASYAPILDALSNYIQHCTAEQLQTDLQGCAWLVHLLPEITESLPEPVPQVMWMPHQERRLMFRAVRRFLDNLAGPAGTLLLLDDLQWAGSDVLDLLQTLARSIPGAPLKIVGAYRATEVQMEHPLAAMLADLAVSAAIVQVPLGPLTDQDAAQVLNNLLTGRAESTEHTDLILRRAGGVPFFLVSYARGVLAADSENKAALRVPWNLAQSVRQRVEAIPPAARELIAVAAIVGRTVPRAVLMAAMTMAETEILPALEAVCRARLVEEDGASGYRFVHDVIREVVEEDLGAARRAALHRRVAEVLEEESCPSTVEVIAYHFTHSDAWAKAVQYLELAGDRAAGQHADSSAESFYRTALERLDEHGRELDGARLREKLADVLSYAARYKEALSALLRAASYYRLAGDLDGLGRVTARSGLIYADKRAPAEGLACLQPLLMQDQGALSHGTRAMLFLALAWLRRLNGEHADELDAASQSAESARAAQDMRTMISAEMHRGLALMALDRSREAIQVWEGTIKMAEAADDARGLCSVLTAASCIYEDSGEFIKARHYTQRALQEAERWGDTPELAYIYTRRGMGAFFLGDWLDAEHHFEEAVAITRRLEPCWVLPWPLLDLGRLCLHEGRWEDAAHYLEASLDSPESQTDINLVREAQCVLAELDLLAGRPAAAKARLTPLLDRPGLKESQVARLLPRLAWAHIELGSVDNAVAYVTEAVTRARAQGRRLFLVDSLLVQARVDIRRRQWEEVESAVREALILARGMPYPYGEGRLLHVYGEMHIQKGDPAPARKRLEEALAIFQRLGARTDRERTEQLLTTLG
jgi:tetratricopeptide (TPR) repeat protein/transcriptional regulator with XRE-family HTH domain